jgi:hypothetical protein
VEGHPIESRAGKPNGPVAAALLAAAISALALGVVTTVGEASEGFKDWLQWNDRVGPLSGKVLIESAVFMVSWVVLILPLRDKDLPWRPVLITSAVLLALGLLGTFPTFFQAFAPE